MVNTSYLASPLVVQNSGRWLGNDGLWSTFYVHAGTPLQHFHVLPSFNGQTVYVPSAKDCANNPIANCGGSRGVEIFASAPSPGFQVDASSSWIQLGNYEMDHAENFGLHGNSLYGYDTAGISFAGGSNDNVTLDHQPVGAYEGQDFWLGQLGLSMFAITMNETEHPASFLWALKEQGHIPSLSFGYQAGAPYVYTKVPGSLILGGYDQSRRSNESILLPSVANVDVGLQSITFTSGNETTTLLNDGIVALIEPAVSEIWLPPSVCDEIASVFGLTYHNASDRYVLTTTAYNALKTLDPVLQFKLGTSVSGGSTISIEIPYKAFDLEASYPIFTNPTRYFPLRRAANGSQYALGRVFLQQAYLIVDWERDTLNISQAHFSAPMPEPNIITISPKLSPEQDGDKSSSGTLKVGAIVGIVFGSIFFALGAVIGYWLWRRKRNRQQIARKPYALQATQDVEIPKKERAFELALYKGERHEGVMELKGDEHHIPKLPGPYAQSEAHELAHNREGTVIVEMEAPTAVHELSDTRIDRRR